MALDTAAIGTGMLQVVANKLKIGRAERTFSEDKWWLVAPLTTIPADGILNGSKGPGFYPSAETMAAVKAWDGMPLTAYHPMDEQGRHTSARADGVLDRQGIGVVRDSVWNGKLQHKGWFDEERTKKVNPLIYTNLKNGIPIETSTGLYTDNVDAPRGSNHRGRPYTWIARNHRPDHIAVLPDQVGACSINDGCGVLVNVAGNHTTSTLVVNVGHWVENCSCSGTCNKCKPSINSLTINPFVSESQRRACYAADDPNWDCDEWNDATPKVKKLPDKKPSVQNLLYRPPLLQVLNFNPEGINQYTYSGGVGERGKMLHEHSQAAHDAVVGLAKRGVSTGRIFRKDEAGEASEHAVQQSSAGNHASAAKYHHATAALLDHAANKAERGSLAHRLTLGAFGRAPDKDTAESIRKASTAHKFAAGEAGGAKGFQHANDASNNAREASKIADRHGVAWLHHAGVNSHLQAEEAWKSEAEKTDDKGLKAILHRVAGEHQKLAWEHGKAASAAEVGGSTKSAPVGKKKVGKYTQIKPTVNQIGGKPSLEMVENWDPFRDLRGRFASSGADIGGAIGAAVGGTLGKIAGVAKAATKSSPGVSGQSTMVGRRGTIRGREVGRKVGSVVGGAAGRAVTAAGRLTGDAAIASAITVGDLVERSRTLAGGAAGTVAGLASRGWQHSKPTLAGIGHLAERGAEAIGEGAGRVVRAGSRAAIPTIAAIGKGAWAGTKAVGRVSSATLLHGLEGGYESLRGNKPYSPTLAPYQSSMAGRFGTGGFGKEYLGSPGSQASALHKFSLEAQNAITSKGIDFGKASYGAAKGAKITQLAYRDAQLGNHGDAAEKHVQAAELLQKAADDLKSWKLQRLLRSQVQKDGSVAPLSVPQLATLTDTDKTALGLENAARKNRTAGIIQGNSPGTRVARTEAMKAFQASRATEKSDGNTHHGHLRAAKANIKARDSWSALRDNEHNALYKRTYQELAQHHNELVKTHNAQVYED